MLGNVLVSLQRGSTIVQIHTCTSYVDFVGALPTLELPDPLVEFPVLLAVIAYKIGKKILTMSTPIKAIVLKSFLFG